MVKVELIHILDRLLSRNVSMDESAINTAALVADQVDFADPVCVHMGQLFSAVERFAERESLQALVDYIVAVASLSDAVNESSQTKSAEGDNERSQEG